MINNSVPKEAVLIYNQALEMANKGKFEPAINEYRRAIETYPKFIEAYNNIGEIYSRMGNREQAISIYLDALKIEKNYRIFINMGVEHFNEKEYDAALKLFKESLKLEPDFLEGNFYTGLVFYHQKNFKKSEKHLFKVVKQDPTHLKANYLLSYIYYEWKDYDRVLRCLDSIKEIADDKLFINRYYGFCYFHLGQYDKAIEYLTEALESKPEYAKFKKYLKSISYEKKIKEIGDVDKAIKILEDHLMDRELEFMEITRLSMLYIFKGENKRAEKLVTSYKKKIAS